MYSMEVYQPQESNRKQRSVATTLEQLLTCYVNAERKQKQRCNIFLASLPTRLPVSLHKNHHKSCSLLCNKIANSMKMKVVSLLGTISSAPFWMPKKLSATNLVILLWNLLYECLDPLLIGICTEPASPFHGQDYSRDVTATIGLLASVADCMLLMVSAKCPYILQTAVLKGHLCQSEAETGKDQQEEQCIAPHDDSCGCSSVMLSVSVSALCS